MPISTVFNDTIYDYVFRKQKHTDNVYIFSLEAAPYKKKLPIPIGQIHKMNSGYSPVPMFPFFGVRPYGFKTRYHAASWLEEVYRHQVLGMAIKDPPLHL